MVSQRRRLPRHPVHPTGLRLLGHFSKNVTAAAPGSAQGLYLIVSDVQAARGEFVARAVEASEVFHDRGGVYAGQDQLYLFGRLRISGPDREHRTNHSFLSFSDPDGNGWVVQEVTARAPGRVAGNTTYTSAGDLSRALKRAAAAHGRYEAQIGQADPNWPEWYAAHMVREQTGEELPQSATTSV